MPRKPRIQREKELLPETGNVQSEEQSSRNCTIDGAEWVKIPRDEYDLLLSQAGELLEAQQKVLRWQADFENYRRRMTREREEFASYASQDVLGKLLVILDNLDRALAAAQHDPASIVQGVEMIRRQQLEILGQEGLVVIDPVGDQFDPNFHEAVLRCEADAETESNTIVEVMQKGYLLKDRLLRPALVKIAYK